MNTFARYLRAPVFTLVLMLTAVGTRAAVKEYIHLGDRTIAIENAPCIDNVYGRGTPAATSAARIDLTWTGQPSTSYNVSRGTATGGPYTLLGSSTVPAYSDRVGLQNGKTYFYVVTPMNGAVAECQSNQATVTIPNGR